MQINQLKVKSIAFYILSVFIVLSSQAQSIKTQAVSLRKQGIEQFRLGNYHLSMACYYQSLDLFIALGDSSKYALTHINLGILNYHLEDYEKATELYQKALDIYLRSNNELKIAQTIIAKIETKYIIDQINQKNAVEIKERNTIIYTSLGGIAILISFLVLLNIQYKKRKHSQMLVNLS